MSSRPDVLRLWAAFGLLGAGLVHLAVTSEHFAESAQHGLFFVVTGGVQLCWALGLMARTSIPAPRALVTVHVGLLALWAMSRTVGLPVPPEAWAAEALGTPDVLTVALELLTVAATVAAVALAPSSPAPRPAAGPRSRSRRFLAGAGAGALLVASLTTPALAATEAGEHAHPHGEQHSAD